MITYRIIVAAIDETDLIETIELTDAEATAYAGDEALFIRTNYDAMGGWQDQRVIPWRRILDYRATTS